MKKLLLLLLPALILTACKDPEDTSSNAAYAKSLAGTYNYTRIGKLKINIPGEGEYMETLNTSGIATITYRDGSNEFHVTLTSDSKDTINTTGLYSDGIMHFQTYSDRYSSEEEFSAKFDVRSEEVVFDNLSILIQESYTGTAHILGFGRSCKGNGLMSMHRITK